MHSSLIATMERTFAESAILTQLPDPAGAWAAASYPLRTSPAPDPEMAAERLIEGLLVQLEALTGRQVGFREDGPTCECPCCQ